MSRKLYVHNLTTNFRGIKNKIENIKKNKIKIKGTVITAYKVI